MTGGCHCGRVSIELAARPDYLNDCNCTLCLKSGALWGYYTVNAVKLNGETGEYVRADVTEPSVILHFCKKCGSTTHWSPAARLRNGRMGVNMRLFDPAELAGVELRFPNGRDWDKSTAYGYVRSHSVFFDVA